MPKLRPEDIAEICHETNRAYCKSQCDFSQAPFAASPDWQIQSAINGVNFRLRNPGAPPSRSHEEWLKEKERDGWKYGPKKDPIKKEHPCFVPYDELPEEQKAKDALFIAIVDALRHLAV